VSIKSLIYFQTALYMAEGCSAAPAVGEVVARSWMEWAVTCYFTPKAEGLFLATYRWQWTPKDRGSGFFFVKLAVHPLAGSLLTRSGSYAWLPPTLPHPSHILSISLFLFFSPSRVRQVYTRIIYI